MKNKIVKMVVVTLSLCLMFCFTACANNQKPSEVKLSQEVGNFITLTSENDAYKNLFSNKGMSGTGGKIHTHNNAADSSFLGAKQDFVFDIGHIEQLGELHVWNYNVAGAVDCGVKDAEIFYSSDNASYKKLNDFTFAKADGKNAINATNLTDGSFINFNGISARFIKVSPKSNYGGAEYGLSEVRAFRFKHKVVEGGCIAAAPWNRLDNKGRWTANATDYNITNGSGMSDAISFSALHDDSSINMTTIPLTSIGFKIDLNGNYPIKKIALWNYNGKDLSIGVNKFKISVSEDGTKWTSSDKKTYALAKGTGEAAMNKSLEITFDKPIHARYFRIDPLSNYGSSTKYGLSEIRFMIGDGWFADDAPDYSALVSNYNGWSGADGTYSVNLDGLDYNDSRKEVDRNTFFVFSDTIISNVEEETNLRNNVYMPNNTSAILKGNVNANNITFQYPNAGKDAANIKPMPAEPSSFHPTTKNKYYWLGDAFVMGGKLYVYALKVDDVDPNISGFGFAQVGVDLACYNIVNNSVDYNSLRIIKDTNNVLCNINNSVGKYYFGGAVLESANIANSDGYSYVYGYLDKPNSGRKLVVSRTKDANIEDFSSYEFLAEDGGWVKNMSNPKFLATDIAPEISVSQIQTGANKGKFLLVNTHMTIGNDIKVSISETPFGEFTNKTSIFYHDSTFTTLGVANNSYNAKAHPALSKKGELLISYNVNGNDTFTYGDIYRSRFIKLAEVPKA